MCFLGYPLNHRGYKCYDLSFGKIIISRHVIFDETQFPFAKLHIAHIQTYDFLDDGPNPYVVHHFVSQYTTPNAQTPGLVPFGANSPNIAIGPTIEPKKNIVNCTNCPTTASPPPSPSPSSRPSLPPRAVTRSQHGIVKPKKIFNLHTTVAKSLLPHNPVSALWDPNWKKAMDDEFDALIKNKTWELVPHPPDVNVIRSLWIFAHKEKSDGSFERHKACLLGDIRVRECDKINY